MSEIMANTRDYPSTRIRYGIRDRLYPVYLHQRGRLQSTRGDAGMIYYTGVYSLWVLIGAAVAFIH